MPIYHVSILHAKKSEIKIEEDIEEFSLGWWGSSAETVSCKVENGLFGEKEKWFGCEKSLFDEYSPLMQVELVVCQ